MATIEDGFGSVWHLCDRTDRPCGLEVVRPGKVQCWCDYEDAEGNCIHSCQTWQGGKGRCDTCKVELTGSMFEPTVVGREIVDAD